MKAVNHLTEQDFKRIEVGVKQAENKISGEIVPVLLQRSYHYPSSKYKCALLASFLSFTVLIVGDRFISDFNIYDPIYYFTWVFAFSTLGFLVPVWWPTIAVALATDKEKDYVIINKAETLFLEHEVFNTRQRSGIMLFVSFDEKKAMVLADTGINQKVEQTEWDSLIENLVGKIKSGNTVGGLEAAIDQCSQILISNGFKKEDDDTNELSDQLITGR